ncbi:MAG TPA: hypothetical protein PLP48_00620 [Acholeplasmataceae bacterium]|nr:hypothetical protein [Acholeplasmataceae bacterium]
MEKREFINMDQMREDMRKMREERMGRMPHRPMIENEVKLFTDKAEMVKYVNSLTGIENVDIYKIEDQLYKVLVSRRVKHEGCCGGQHHHEE